MNTAEVARQLVALCQKGQFDEAMNSLYADNIVSVEAMDMNNMPRETRGIAGVRQKAEWWNANHTMHSFTTSGPFVAVDKFAAVFTLDVTDKTTGKRHQMSEVAVYTVEGGKVVHEEFLYQA